MRRKWKYTICVILAALLAGPLLTSWVFTEWEIRTLLDKRTAPLSESQKSRVNGYIKGDWWCRPPGLGIFQARQAELVTIAIERMESMPHYDFLLGAIARQWALGRQERYGTLPKEINAAIRARGSGLDNVLSVVMEQSGHKIDQHIDIESVLRAEDKAASVVCFYLDLNVLYKYRTACLDVLRLDDKVMCKIFLLAQIAHDKAGSAWFAGQEDLLTSLCQSGDNNIKMYAEEIRTQLENNQWSQH